MPSTVSACTVPPVTPSPGFLASLRKVGAFLAAKARALAAIVRATGARVAQVVADKLAIAPTSVLPLALVALVIVALVLARA